MKPKTINVITLGCSKNLVDSEVLLKQFESNNFEITYDNFQEYSDITVINTCGFINDAKEESIDTIVDFIEAKKQGKIQELYVIGCLSERYKEQLEKEIPEVDKYFGVTNIKDIVENIDADYKKELVGERFLTTPKHYAYLKISEGCDRTCSFCAIPLIRGKHKSKQFDAVIAEAKYMVKQGVKELILIAQDLSYYGVDLYQKQRLPELVEALSEIEGVEWIRIHYTYPNNFPKDLLRVMHEKSNVCSYLDIALQHVSDNVLSVMKRNITKQQTYELIADFKKQVPGINLRTTLLVGHPGETEQDFNELIDFVKEVRFDRLGVFTYSDEENTYAADNYSDDLSQEIKQERADKIMDIQQQISLELNQQKIGKHLKIVIDKIDGDFYIGRTEFDSPEVDNEVVVPLENNDLEIGKFYNAEIIDAEDYDLIAKIVS